MTQQTTPSCCGCCLMTYPASPLWCSYPRVSQPQWLVQLILVSECTLAWNRRRAEVAHLLRRIVDTIMSTHRRHRSPLHLKWHWEWRCDIVKVLPVHREGMWMRLPNIVGTIWLHTLCSNIRLIVWHFCYILSIRFCYHVECRASFVLILIIVYLLLHCVSRVYQ